MIYIQIGGRMFPAKVKGFLRDAEWNGRSSKAITLEMTHEEAANLFVDGAKWRIVGQPDAYEEYGEIVVPDAEIYDNSEYDVAGSITDNRDGTITVKMGKSTAEELLAIIKGEV